MRGQYHENQLAVSQGRLVLSGRLIIWTWRGGADLDFLYLPGRGSDT